jgi:hypothetical protein
MRLLTCVIAGAWLIGAAAAGAQDVGFGSAWPELTPRDRDAVMKYGEDFKAFLGKAKSEMGFVREAIRFAEASGFRKWDAKTSAGAMKPGSRWYAVNRDRTIVLFVVGTEPMENGLRIVNTHIDSPRIEFKTKPFRDSQLATLIDTQVHGGIKNYQWANVPLAISGRVDRADGTTAWIEIGNDPADPVLLISDLAPHVDRTSAAARSAMSFAPRSSIRSSARCRRIRPSVSARARIGCSRCCMTNTGSPHAICSRPICRSCRPRSRATSGWIARWLAPTGKTIAHRGSSACARSPT